MRRLCPILFVLLLAVPAGAVASPGDASMQRVQFSFHSGFLMNLHHFLYNLATHPDRMAAFQGVNALSAEETESLQQAVAFYKDNYAKRDLLFDDELAAIKRTLSVANDARQDPHGLALPPALLVRLRATTALYAKHAWPAHDAANRTWIREARTLDTRYGADVQARIERGLAAGFPATPVRVDLVVETGKRQGAYTDLQAVIPSGRPSYQGLASLEMLYHESSHVQTTAPLEAAIAAQMKAARKQADSELWHVLQFYTVGRAVAGALARDGIAYRPYADRVGLFEQVWGDFVPLIAADWQPWLDGKESEDAALAHIVAKLPANQ